MNRIKIISGLLFLIITFCACTKEINSYNDNTKLKLNIRTERFDGENTRSAGFNEDFDNMYIYLFRDGEISTNSNCYFDPQTSTIQADGLQDGNYKVLVLTVYGDSSLDGVTVNKIVSTNDTWITFPSELSSPLSADYLYGSYEFNVTNGVINEEMPTISLKHIVSKISFNPVFANQYTEASAQKLDCSFSFSNYTEFRADNTYSGKGQTVLSELSIMDNREYLLLPAVEESRMTGSVNIATVNHNKEEFSNEYLFSVNSEANKKSVVNTEISHPNDTEGMIYSSQRTITEENFYKILQDDEPQEIYYDKNLRYFYINSPLQVSIDDEKKMLNLRSYCIVPLKDITIYAKFPGTNNQYVKFAYIDEIDGLGNISYPIPSVGKELFYTNEDGKNIGISLTMPDIVNANFEFRIESDYYIYQKYEYMTPRWKLDFHSYGGDPDQEDGKPSGYWIGIRPVHIREAIAWLSNLAYVCSKPEYVDAVVNYPGELVGNDKMPIVGEDRKTIVNALLNLSHLRIGLIDGDGTGVGGLAGGYIFGVYQEAYLTHYNSQMHSIKMYHELGHCMGYNHDSSMTYGDWARYVMPPYYFAHLSDAIVTSREVLKSYANPNLYRFH